MTARARHDRGDRGDRGHRDHRDHRIYPDADACGMGGSIQAVQPWPPHRAKSFRFW
jgi:hypothetical protein